MLNIHGLFLGTLKTLSHIVDLLEFGNGIFGNSGDGGIKFPVFRGIGQTVLELTIGGQETGTIGLELTILTTNTKLNGKPKNLKMFLECKKF